MSQPHAADPIGARDLAAEAGKDLSSAPKPEQSSRETKREPKTSHGTDATLLKCVQTLQLLRIPHEEVSTFVPSAHMMYTVLTAMDELMHTNRYWQNRSLRWSPILSRLYYGILFYIQILRCMNFAGIATAEHKRLLRDFSEDYSFEELPVAGPMMVFMKALCVSQPPNSEYGFVSPCIPANTGATQATSHALSPLVRTLLPNMTGLRRAAIRMRNVVGNHAQPWDHSLGNETNDAPNVPIAHNADNEQARDARIMPGTVQPISWNERTRDFFAREPTCIRIPPVGDPAGPLSWEQFLGLDGNLKWFSDLSGIMANHAKHWNGSGNLGQCSIFDGHTGQIICIGEPALPDRTAHRAAAVESIPHTAVLSSCISEPSPPSESYAACTQINWVPPNNFGHEDDHAGAVGQTRLGPWWNIQPPRFTSVRYDPTPALATVLSDHLHLDRPADNPATQ